MEREEIRNAVIKGVQWNRERGLTQLIEINGGGWGCSFGGYHLGESRCYKWIMALMDIFDLYEFKESDLVGKVIRVKFSGNRICAIGHPVEEKWLEPKVIFGGIDQ